MKIWKRTGPTVSQWCWLDKGLMSIITLRYTSYVVLPMPRKRLQGNAALKQMGRPVHWVSDKYR